jgi:hypothetical protein
VIETPDPRFPWITLVRQPGGRALVRNSRTGASALVADQGALAQFIAQNSAAPGYGGLGDAVRGVTKRLGFGECTPCARRQAMLNGLMPRVFRR